ncbi:dipeptide ABC transporter ATP-binding protein [Achromobacter aegrifaciens]
MPPGRGRASNPLPPTLSVQSLTIGLPEGSDRPHAVQGVSFELVRGRTLCVVGESGSGKSVMASAVIGLQARELQMEKGSISLNGEDLMRASPERWRALRGASIGMVFQEPMTALNPVMRCGDQIDELLRCHTTWTKAVRRARIVKVLAEVQLADPERIANSYPHQLSGGQRQRIVIAMAIILAPPLLICDEPTTALDVTTQAEILRLLQALRERQGMAVLFITHDMGVVAQIADDVLVMNQGQVIESGPRDQVLYHPAQAYTKQLLAAVPSMDPPPPRPAAQGPVLLGGTGLGKAYVRHRIFGPPEKTVALHDAALGLQRGETVGIIGESGSGKSTLARCLMRLIEPSCGEIRWNGKSVEGLSEHKLRPLRRSVQVVFQDPNRSLNPRLRVGESMIEGAMNLVGLSREQAWAQAEKLMDKVRLPRQCLYRYPREFSGGQRQRLAIARALACRPDVLIADEAVSALDVSVQAQILVLLRELQDELGLGILFITHDLRVAAQLCDRAIVMHKGQIVEAERTADLYANPQHPYTRKLFSAAPVLHRAAAPSMESSK